MYDMKKFGDTVARNRKVKGLTQEALAKQLGISPQAVSKWENGVGLPDVTLFPVLAEALGVSIETLFGREPGAESDSDSSGYFKGLPFAAAGEDIACYSNKSIDRTEGSMVFFTDGSTADLKAGIVVNRGKGEIRIAAKDDAIGQKNAETKILNADLDPFESIDISISVPCDVEIASGETPSLCIAGNKKIVESFEWHIESGIFKLGVLSFRGNVNGKKMQIALVCPFEKGKNLKLTIAGDATCKISPDFADSHVEVAGSGEAHLHNGEKVYAAVHGSGDIYVGTISDAFFGSVNGSGDIGVEKATDADVSVCGSGDIKLQEVSGNIRAMINGSGDIAAAGNVKELILKITGSGDFDGRKLLCDRADIKLAGTARADIGEICGESTEIVSDNAELNVKKRGYQ